MTTIEKEEIVVRTYIDKIILDKSDPQTEKKISVHNLFREYKSIEQTFEGFAKWLSLPMTENGLKQLSRQNVNDWFRCNRLPFPEKFRIIMLLSKGQEHYSGQHEFCVKMLHILEDVEEEE